MGGLLGIRAGGGGARQASSLRMAMDWPEGRGLTTVVNVGRPAPLPWAALERDTGLGPEARIKAGDFAADSTLVGVGWEKEVGKSTISYFSILDKNICTCRYYLQTELNCLLRNKRVNCWVKLFRQPVGGQTQTASAGAFDPPP